MNNKPLVFNYGHFETLREVAYDQALEIEKLKAENERLKDMLNQMRIKIRIMENDKNDNYTR